MTGHILHEPPTPEHTCEPPLRITKQTSPTSGSSRNPIPGALWQCDCGHRWIFRWAINPHGGTWHREPRHHHWIRTLRHRLRRRRPPRSTTPTQDVTT